jgi:hypothetical protein
MVLVTAHVSRYCGKTGRKSFDDECHMTRTSLFDWGIMVHLRFRPAFTARHLGCFFSQGPRNGFRADGLIEVTQRQKILCLKP